MTGSLGAPANDPSPASIGVGDRVRYRGAESGRIVGKRDGILTIRFDGADTREIVDSFAGLARLEPWAEGRISPPRGELTDDRLAPPLSRGERELVAMLDRSLEPEWRIYVRPHLDAERPLLAAVHPRRGGMIWDVVDWRRSDIEVEGDVWRLWTDDGVRALRSPLRYLDDVRNKLYGVYLPEIGEAVGVDTRRFGLVRAGLYFENEETASVASLGQSSWTVFGRDAVARGIRAMVMPAFSDRVDWDPSWFDAFDSVLGRVYRLPDALASQPLSPEQDRLATPAPGVEVITGVAGSGKSVVVAYRAARIAAEGRSVLVLTFNRTLTNYIRGVLRRVPVRHDPTRITVLHFHELLARVFAHHRLPKPLQDIPEGEGREPDESRWLDEEWPTRALTALRELGVPEALRFDALLVDEGQDFGPTYVAVLAELLGGADAPEVVIAIDPAQRIYSRQAALIEGGPWKSRARRRSMRRGYRLPPAGARVASAFAELHGLDTVPIGGPEETLLPGSFSWIRTVDDATTVAAAVGVLDRWRAEPSFLAGRAAVLVTSKQMGEALVRLLWERGYQTNHVFPVLSQGEQLGLAIEPTLKPEWRIARSHKTAFAFGDSRLKVSTIHSFKGWDANRVILALPSLSSAPTERQLAEVYVGLTRAREDTVVIGAGQGLLLERLPIDRIEVEVDGSIAGRYRELVDEAAASRGEGLAKTWRPTVTHSLSAPLDR